MSSEKEDNSLVEETKSGDVMPFQATGFNHRLQQYMNQPMDPDLERRFAAALLTMSFVVPVQTGKRASSSLQPKAGLTLALAVTTYLADGQQYIPVFTDKAKMQEFLSGAPQLDPFRSFEFTSQELMGEVEKLDISGILVNPGYQNFPLNLDYWNYIHQVAPIVISENEKDTDFKFRIIQPVPDKLHAALARELRHIRKAEKAWLIEMKLKNEARFEYTVVVEYKGKKEDFQLKVARKLAKAAHRYLPHGADILVGTAEEAIGLAVKLEVDPFYERKGWL